MQKEKIGMIYKRCDRCRKRLPPGTKCTCTNQRHKEYDRYARDKKADDFYHSRQWDKAREDAIAYYNGMDIYSYYILNKIEYGDTVHHIVPLKEDWSKRADKDNLIYLTESNHQQIHKAMREGQHDEIIKLLQGAAERYRREFNKQTSVR